MPLLTRVTVQDYEASASIWCFMFLPSSLARGAGASSAGSSLSQLFQLPPIPASTLEHEWSLHTDSFVRTKNSDHNKVEIFTSHTSSYHDDVIVSKGRLRSAQSRRQTDNISTNFHNYFIADRNQCHHEFDRVINPAHRGLCEAKHIRHQRERLVRVQDIDRGRSTRTAWRRRRE